MTIIWCRFLRYPAWQTEPFFILDHFLPFYPPNNQKKNQNFEKLKKRPGDIIILHKCTKNHGHMLYCSLDMAHNRCNLFYIFGYFLPLYLPNNPKNQNLKKWKKHLEISLFYNSVPKIMIICYTVPEIWHAT